MLVSECCQLGQMGDAQHLMLAGKLPQLLANDSPNAPADPLVDFVEDQRGDKISLDEYRQFAIGSEWIVRTNAFGGISEIRPKD